MKGMICSVFIILFEVFLLMKTENPCKLHLLQFIEASEGLLMSYLFPPVCDVSKKEPGGKYEEN